MVYRYSDVSATLLGKFLGAALMSDKTSLKKHNMGSLDLSITLDGLDIDHSKLFELMEKVLAKEGIVAVHADQEAAQVAVTVEPVAPAAPVIPVDLLAEVKELQVKMEGMIVLLNNIDTNFRVRLDDAINAASYITGERVGDLAREEVSLAGMRFMPTPGEVADSLRQEIIAVQEKLAAIAGA